MQDAHALISHERSRHAQAEGWTEAEIVPVLLPDGSVVSEDDSSRRIPDHEKLRRLRPAFAKVGTEKGPLIASCSQRCERIK